MICSNLADMLEFDRTSVPVFSNCKGKYTAIVISDRGDRNWRIPSYVIFMLPHFIYYPL
jgi:hypothetical protein